MTRLIQVLFLFGISVLCFLELALLARAPSFGTYPAHNPLAQHPGCTCPPDANATITRTQSASKKICPPGANSSSSLSDAHYEYIGGTVGRMYAAAAGFPVVDAVFTFVNGSDPHFRAELANYSKVPEESRYRDFGQLRYGMRSVLQYAPWIRSIILVVSDKQRQVPSWLDAQHPMIRIVEHRDIWADPSQLPSFSSHQIEWNLHRIPWVAPNILYINDDMAITLPLVANRHLWSHPGRHMLHEHWVAPKNASEESDAFGRSLAHVHTLFDQRYGTETIRNVAAHAPILINTTVVKMIRDDWKMEFDQMYRRSRFRTDFDIQFQFAYQQYIRSKKDDDGRPVFQFENASDTEYYHMKKISNRGIENRMAFRKIKNTPRQFLCLQDKLVETGANGRQFHEVTPKRQKSPVLESVTRLYEDLFPEKAPWEATT